MEKKPRIDNHRYLGNGLWIVNRSPEPVTLEQMYQMYDLKDVERLDMNRVESLSPKEFGEREKYLVESGLLSMAASFEAGKAGWVPPPLDTEKPLLKTGMKAGGSPLKKPKDGGIDGSE